jgi:hypothetical protein
MLKFITTKKGCSSLVTARGVGAGCGTAAFALVVMNTGVEVFQVSVLLFVSAALVQVFRRSAEVGTRALAPAYVRAGLVTGLASGGAAGSARTHQGQGGTRRRGNSIPAFRGLGGK